MLIYPKEIINPLQDQPQVEQSSGQDGLVCNLNRSYDVFPNHQEVKISRINIMDGNPFRHILLIAKTSRS